MVQMKGGEFIAEFLIRDQIPYVFGICGHGNVVFELGKPCLLDVHVDANIRPPATGTWPLPPTPHKGPTFGERYVQQALAGEWRGGRGRSETWHAFW